MEAACTKKSAADLLEKEDKRLTEEKLSCPLTKLSANSVESLRFLGKDHSVTIACVVKILRTSPTDKWFWSVLGDLYQTRGDHSLSNICFKQALKLAGKITSLPKEWHFLGPFVIGKTELDGDPLEYYGGIKNVSKFRTQKSVKYFSELVPDAKVQWKTVTAQILDEHSIGLKVLPQINWNDLVSSLGSLGITEWQGWLVGEFGVNDKELNVLLQCHGVHTLFIDEYVLTGDVYHRESFWFSVPLKKGVHTIKIRLRTKVSQQLKCSLKTAPSSFAVLSPSFLPDIVDGYLFSPYVAIPISNYHHSRWVRNIRISVDSHSGNLLGSLKVSLLPVSELAVAPGQTRSVNIELHSSSIRITENCQDAQIKLKISSSEGSQLLPLTLRCRRHHQSFLWTFIDHDGSVQHAAAIEPLGKCDGSITRTDRPADRPSCPVLLTLHGTTVPPQNQADSYKHMVGGEFVFGVREAWILAPTRHGAHNWEGPGALTALTALTRLAEMTEKHDWVEHPASPNHVIFAGHSMGGHGAWHLATHYPDLCLGLVSLAGWIKKEEYGDSNLFFRHDISTSDTDPAVKGIMEACVAENDADRHVSNLKGIPVMVRIGADDRTVHPLFSRRMVRRLAEEGVSVTYRELAGKEHWWWDTRETNDGGAVNDKDLRNFVGEVTRGSLGDTSSCVKDREGCGTSKENAYVAGKNPPGVEDFTYITMNPAFGGGLKGIRIMQQVTPFRISKIKMKRNEEEVTLTTVNVARFRIRESINRPIKWKFLNLKIDGQVLEAGQLSMVLDDPKQHFCRVNGRWEVFEWTPDSPPRGPLTLGPARRVAEAPLIIVTGCQGSESRTESLLNQAVYIANLFHLTSDTSVPIIRDKDTDVTQLRDSNLIIIGNEKENSLTSHFLQNTPINADEDHLVLGKCSFGNPRTGLMTLAPHGDLHLAMLLFGLTPDGMKDIVALATPTIPPMTRSPFSNLLPDFVVTGPEFGAKGPGGFECTGFWGNNWEYRPDLVSCSC